MSITFDRLRSLLFVPADSERFIAGAASRGADALILDLEDGVSDQAKGLARQRLGRSVLAMRRTDQPVLVRVNHVPELLELDLVAALDAGADGIVLPKVESSQAMQAFDALLGHHTNLLGRATACPIIAVIETPRGVCNAHSIAQASSNLRALCFGPEDYSNAMEVDPTTDALAWPAQATANASVAAALIPLGLTFSVADFTNLAQYRRLATHAKRIGMRGAPCIHPSQVQVLNEVFSGTADEFRSAQALVDAFDAAVLRGSGSIAFDGRMVDRPVAERARRFLDRWRGMQVAEAVSINKVVR